MPYARVKLPIPIWTDRDISANPDPGVPEAEVEEAAYRDAWWMRFMLGYDLRHLVSPPRPVRTGEGWNGAHPDPLAPPEVAAAVHRGIARAASEAEERWIVEVRPVGEQEGPVYMRPAGEPDPWVGVAAEDAETFATRRGALEAAERRGFVARAVVRATRTPLGLWWASPVCGPPRR